MGSTDDGHAAGHPTGRAMGRGAIECAAVRHSAVRGRARGSGAARRGAIRGRARGCGAARRGAVEDDRGPGEEGDALALAVSKDLVRASIGGVVAVLHRHHLTQRSGLDQLIHRDVGHADVADLARLLEFDEGSDGIGVRHLGVGHVDLEEIEALDPEPSEALVALLADVLGSPEGRQ